MADSGQLHRYCLVLGLALLEPAPAAFAEKTTTAATATAAAAAAGEAITLELIMSDPDWIGNRPTDPYWSDDGGAVYFEQKRSGEELRDLIRIDLENGEATRIDDVERGTEDVREGHLSRDRKRKVYSRHGDIYLKDLVTGRLTQLTRTAGEETDPRFMADASRVVFRRGQEIFVRDLETSLEYQPVDLRLLKDPRAEKPEDDFLSRQQLRLFDVLRREKSDREAARDHAEAEQAADPMRPPLPFYLGEEIEIRQAVLSPTGEALVLVVADEKNDPGPKDQMPAWVTETGYVTSREVRSKVGTRKGPGEALVYLDLAARQRHDVDLSALPGISEDPLAELKRQAAAQARDAGARDAEDGDSAAAAAEPAVASATIDEDTATAAGEGAEGGADEEADAAELRPVTFDEAVAWSPDGTSLAVQAHAIDNKDRWIALVDVAEKTLDPIHRLSNEAWINWFYNDFGWFSDSRRLYFLSEESGYSQLYLHSLDDDSTRRLTDGDYVVSDVVLGPRERYFYYTANPDHPGVYETYRVDVDSGRIEQLTRLGGRNSSLLSPDGANLLVTHSSLTRPQELYVQAARPGAEARQLTDNVSEAFRALPWVEPDIVAVPSSHHERPIYSRYYPAQVERPDGSRPAVVFVHGAGYLQNAHKGWSGYFREFMFHTFLAQRGYAVLDMDYRASAGYGAEWRTAIYRQMGTPELEDLEDGVAWLISEQGIDARKVGVYGGSYGGFMTMMALFKQPDLFACGAALRPVTDWAHYNHSYTSNILNTPDVDPEAFRRSSPIELAEGLEKPLLICVPMQDDNVFFQDTVRLAQRLIELEKEDWEVAIFPVEPHGFLQPASWLNQYRRIFKLFETYLGQ